jgi:putative ABC transport system permease protein
MTLSEIIMSLEIGLIYGIVAIGVYLAFRIIDFPDLTCDGSFVLGMAVSAILIKSGYGPWASLLISLIFGCIAGLITGILNVCFKVSNLLSGILVAFMLYSINLHVMGGVPNITLIDLNTIFTNVSVLAVLAVISIVICLLLGYLLVTDFGLALRSIGQNKKLAQNIGVNVQAATIIGLALSNGLIAFGGALFNQHQSFADVGSGVGTVIVGLASVMIGEKVLPYRSMLIQIISCLLGSIIYRLLIGFALHSEVLGLETQDLNLITGLMIIGIMYIPKFKT